MSSNNGKLFRIFRVATLVNLLKVGIQKVSRKSARTKLDLRKQHAEIGTAQADVGIRMEVAEFMERPPPSVRVIDNRELRAEVAAAQADVGIRMEVAEFMERPLPSVRMMDNRELRAEVAAAQADVGIRMDVAEFMELPPSLVRVMDNRELRAEVAVAVQAVVCEVMQRLPPSVWVADNVVPANLRELLNSGLDVIATGPYKDYHPGTGDKVQALIHPSMFPYIEGVSTVPDLSILPPQLPAPYPQRWGVRRVTSKYQWLPAQFYVDKDGSTSVKSYINNLDLSHQDLYRAIELCFSLFLPMFESIVGSLQHLRSRELQVIVKAANYVIPPGGETYKGEWHVDGMPYEHIIASGIYYYSTSPHLRDIGLAFRRKIQSVDTSMGEVQTKEGRMLVFSNELQHQVSGIVNESKTEVGIRKILCFFLIDPQREIVSTKHVPEQQWDHMRPRVMTALNEVVRKAIGREMPPEILLEITEWAKTGFTLEEARQHRLICEEKRKYILVNNSLRMRGVRRTS